MTDKEIPMPPMSPATTTSTPSGPGSDGPRYSTQYFLPADPIITLDLKVGELPDVEQMKEDLKEFNLRIPRFQWLKDYYLGANPPINNYGVSPMSNFCAYFADMLVGYMTGIPPSYSAEKEDKYADAIIELYDNQNMEQQEADIVLDLSMYGRTFQLIYEDDDNIPRSVIRSPMTAYVCYNNSVNPDSVYGVLIREEKDKKGTRQILDVYTRTQHVQYTIADDSWVMTEEPKLHRFTRVPLIEYINGRFGKGVYEGIISLQDAYNALQEDRSEDKRKFNAATLYIKGQILGMNREQKISKLEQLKQLGVLELADDAEAGYLVKTFDEAGVQVYQDHLGSNIHKFARIPDLSDEQFAGNASGVAMQYKLFGTDQLAGQMAIGISKGFNRRCKLYDAAINNGIANPMYETSANVSKMQINFKYNVPTDIQYEAQAMATLIGAGLISRKTALELISVIKDAAAELLQIEQEEQAASERQMAQWGGDPYSGNENAYRYPTNNTDELP